MRARGDPAGRTERFPTEPFYHRYDDGSDSSATGVGAEETNSVVCMVLSTLPKRTTPLTERSSGQYSPVVVCYKI